jgi:hypothetical protein
MIPVNALKVTPHLSMKTTFFLVFAILAASNVLSVIIGWFSSVDVKGWWPVILPVYLLISCIYALAFSFIARIGSRFSLRFSALFNLVLAALLLGQSALFYSIYIDWLAVNDGRATLTLFQRIVRSDMTTYALHGVFLGAALICALQHCPARR